MNQLMDQTILDLSTFRIFQISPDYIEQLQEYVNFLTLRYKDYYYIYNNIYNMLVYLNNKNEKCYDIIYTAKYNSISLIKVEFGEYKYLLFLKF